MERRYITVSPLLSGAIMDLVRRAECIARLAHEGQVDKAGEPYITHPLRVAAKVEKAGGTAEQVAVALLHDVLEDTYMTASDLTDTWLIPEDVVEAVESLTKQKNESYAIAVARAAQNPLARLVKMCDIADNSDPERLQQLDKSTQERLVKKYNLGRSVLANYS